MATYDVCGKDVRELVDELMEEYYPELAEAGVTVACLYAYAPKNDATGEPKGPALKVAGMQVPALVKVNSLKDRVEGKADATILLDGDTWGDLTEGEQRAVIDRELMHLELLRDDAGQIKTDDCGRPRLKFRPCDWSLSGFDAVLKRHKTESLEWKSYCDLNRHFTQKEFQFG